MEKGKLILFRHVTNELAFSKYFYAQINVFMRRSTKFLGYPLLAISHKKILVLNFHHAEFFKKNESSDHDVTKRK